MSAPELEIDPTIASKLVPKKESLILIVLSEMILIKLSSSLIE